MPTLKKNFKQLLEPKQQGSCSSKSEFRASRLQMPPWSIGVNASQHSTPWDHTGSGRKTLGLTGPSVQRSAPVLLCLILSFSRPLSLSFSVSMSLLLLVSLPSVPAWLAFCLCLTRSVSHSLAAGMKAHGVFSPSLHDAGVICTDRC